MVRFFLLFFGFESESVLYGSGSSRAMHVISMSSPHRSRTDFV